MRIIRVNDDRLIVRLTLSIVTLTASTVTACCLWTVWSYWYYELNADCADGHDCKCLLFGESFAVGNGFAGGRRLPCQYVFFSAWASAGLAACTSVYFGCGWLRTCSRRSTARRDVLRPEPSSNLEVDDEIDGPSGSESCPQITGVKICFIIIFTLITLNTFIASIVLTNGYISTCLQYVHRVKNLLMATGNMVELVSKRMSCSTIYDFMDYLQGPSRQVIYELLHRHKSNPRNVIINTSVLLIWSIFMSWLATAVWLILTFCIYYFR